MTQVLHPAIGILSPQAWTLVGVGGDGHLALDEGVDTHDGDTTYIRATGAVNHENHVEDGTDPSTDKLHKIRVVAKAETISGSPDFSNGLIIRLRFSAGGGGSYASFAFFPTASYQVFEYTLTDSEAAAITDYTDLRMRVVGAAIGGTGSGQWRVTAWQLEIPSTNDSICESATSFGALQSSATAQLVFSANSATAFGAFAAASTVEQTDVFIVRTTASDLGGGADFSVAINQTTAAAANIIATVAGNSTEVSFGFSASGVPNNPKWTTGNWTLEVNVAVAMTDGQLAIQVHRINSAGTVQESSDITAEQSIGSTGIKNYTITKSGGLSWSPGAASDRFRVDYRIRKTTAGNGTVRISVNDTNAELRVPILRNQPYLASSATGFGAFQASATAQLVFSCNGATSFGALAAAATAQLVFSASSATSFGAFQSAATAISFAASSATSFGALQAAAAAQLVFSASSATSFGALQSDAAAFSFPTTSDTLFGAFQCTATALLVFECSSATVFGSLQASAACSLVYEAASATLFGTLAAAATGQLSFACSSATAFGAIQGAASCELVFLASSNTPFGSLQAAGTAVFEAAVAASSHTAFGALQAAATAQLVFKASSATLFGPLAAAGLASSFAEDVSQCVLLAGSRDLAAGLAGSRAMLVALAGSLDSALELAGSRDAVLPLAGARDVAVSLAGGWSQCN